MVYDEAPDWATLIEITEDLIENKADNNFKFICFDTVDELVEIAKKEVVRLDYRTTGERHEFNACFGGYGRPREKVTELINNLMTRLEDSGYGIIWIGHTKYKTVNEKNGDSYDMLTSNLSNDYDGIFANKADIVMMIDIEKNIEDGFVQDTQRYMWFRGDGFVDAGGRFSQIEQKVEFSVDNYIKAVSDAIRAEIKSHKVDDKYIAEKAKQEQQEREAYYKENKEKLMQEDPTLDNVMSDLDTCNELKAEIKKAVNDLDQDGKKAVQAKLEEAGLPIQYNKVNDPDTLAKILSIVAQ
jgi:hypothetical protein